MKMLLLNPPMETFSMFTLDNYSKKARSHQVPLWSLYLQSYLKDQHDIKIIDMAAKEMSIKSIESEIDTFQPDLIGISCVISKVIVVRELSNFIKENFRIPIVIGGVHASLYPYEMLSLPSVDYIVAGFGQLPLERLCHRLELEQSVDDIPNVYTRKNCTEKTKGSFEFVNVDEFPMPDRGVLDVNDYVMPLFTDGPCTSMITSLGCPYSCNFCFCRKFRPVRLRSVDKIIEEMKHVESLGITFINFQDELFTMSTGRIHDLCSAMIFNEIRVGWSVRSRANLINKGALELMKKAGCKNVHLGIESGNDRILTEMNKGITTDEIKESVNMIKESGINVTASFMLGYKDETEKEIMNTIEFAKGIELNNAQFFVTCPEPGTPLYDDLIDIKNLPENIYSSFTMNPEGVDLNNNIASTIFSRKDMDNFLEYAYSQTPNLYTVKGN